MKHILTLLALLTTCFLQAQNHLIGAKGGVYLGNVVNKLSGQLGDEDFRTGASAGITYDFLFKKHFSAGVDLMYLQRGYRVHLYFTDANGMITDDGMEKWNHDYVAIPIKLGIHGGKKFYGFGNVALTPAMLVNAKRKTPVLDSKGQITGTSILNVYKGTRPFDLGGMLEVGAGYKFREVYWLYLSCTAHRGAIPLYRGKTALPFFNTE